MLDSGTPSGRLKQETQMFELMGWAPPFSPIASPQHMQVRVLILSCLLPLPHAELDFTLGLDFCLWGIHPILRHGGMEKTSAMTCA